jgi:bifunctional ADP-heptose synthase (sugar kinase/adenylyltransferase)
VVVFGEDTPNQILALIQPNIHVKGGDYLPEQLPEREVVEKFGGKVMCLELVPGFSTTGLIETLKT